MTFAFLLCSLAFPLSPCLGGDGALSVVPLQIAFDSSILFFVIGRIGVVPGELFQGREMTFDSVQPRGVGSIAAVFAVLAARCGVP